MNSVLVPSVLFIDEHVWLDEAKRDAFLAHFLAILECIETYQHTRIYWTIEWEHFLWESPQIPPWRQDKMIRNTIIPLIYKKFPPLQEYIDTPLSKNTCTSVLSIPYSQEIEAYFHQFIHLFIERAEAIYLVFGFNQKGDKLPIFTCTCHPQKLAYEPILKAKDWLKHLDAVTQYWANNTIEEAAFHQAINLAYHQKNNQAPPNYVLSSNFIRSIQRPITVRHKQAIINSIVKRLSLTRYEASRDGQLQDEQIKKTKEYRFRVTPRPTSNRIHYTFEGKDEHRQIKLLCYYGEGEHDDGL